MFETTSDISVKDNQSENIPTRSQPLSLPLIPAKPASRGQLPARKDFGKKQKLYLPNIKENEDPVIKMRQQEDIKSADEQNKNKNTFALEVQQKLKKVLGGMQNNTEKELVQSFGDDDFDFEAQVNKNKQIIKQHKIKKENENHKGQKQKTTKPPKAQKQRNQSLYQKRARQYRDQSIQNKYLSKKKQTAKEKNVNIGVRESSKDIKPRNQYYAKVPSAKRDKQKKHNNRALSHKGSHKDLMQLNKSANLFDGIQNFLQNPTDTRKQSKDQLIGLSLLKAKRDIQDKIKMINQKLGANQQSSQQNPSYSNRQKILSSQSSNRDWRRIQFRQKQIHCHQSNFDKELDRINSLQQKNSLSLDHYLEHQKILMQLQMHRKQLFKRKQASSQ